MDSRVRVVLVFLFVFLLKCLFFRFFSELSNGDFFSHAVGHSDLLSEFTNLVDPLIILADRAGKFVEPGRLRLFKLAETLHRDTSLTA
jgi:hypothetical protein